ncbi:MAG: sensor domain-containing diguanylate cyclase [Gammaproteobacteria bacterium]|nr:sensor domain-containing diguanylate cyclase [Gammaproteobacteria bacterium]
MFSFRNKLVIAFFLFGALLISISSLLIFTMQELSLKATSIETAQQTHQKLDEDIGSYIHKFENSLNALEKSKAFQQYLNNPSANKAIVNDLFSSFISSSDNIYQYRYIDINGMEKIRADRKDFGENVFFTAEDKLQSKLTRYYFRETIKTDKEIFYSKIDLNIEHGKIENPIKPVIRIAKKVVLNGKTAGILIINVLMDRFIERLSSSAIFDIYLIDKNGFFLAHPEKDKRWSLYLNTNHNAKDIFSDKTECILNNTQCQTKEFYSRDIQSLRNPDHLKLIIQPRLLKIHKQMEKQFSDMLLISFAVLLLSFPIAYLFAITPTRLKSSVDQLNASLERKIKEKVDELKNSNLKLEQKVLERTQELEESNTKLYLQATIDPLTQIPNRRYFFEMSDRYLQLSHRKRQLLTFIIFDIDFFKKVNDSYGHNTGDQVLKFITEKISLQLRRSDIFGRIGGDEFAIALLDTNIEEATEIAEKLRTTIQEAPYSNKSITVELSISLGITEAKENEQEVSFILSRADVALYQAKNNGRNQVAVS